MNRWRAAYPSLRQQSQSFHHHRNVLPPYATLESWYDGGLHQLPLFLVPALARHAHHLSSTSSSSSNLSIDTKCTPSSSLQDYNFNSIEYEPSSVLQSGAQASTPLGLDSSGSSSFTAPLSLSSSFSSSSSSSLPSSSSYPSTSPSSSSLQYPSSSPSSRAPPSPTTSKPSSSIVSPFATAGEAKSSSSVNVNALSNSQNPLTVDHKQEPDQIATMDNIHRYLSQSANIWQMRDRAHWLLDHPLLVEERRRINLGEMKLNRKSLHGKLLSSAIAFDKQLLATQSQDRCFQSVLNTVRLAVTNDCFTLGFLLHLANIASAERRPQTICLLYTVASDLLKSPKWTARIDWQRQHVVATTLPPSLNGKQPDMLDHHHAVPGLMSAFHITRINKNFYAFMRGFARLGKWDRVFACFQDLTNTAVRPKPKHFQLQLMALCHLHFRANDDTTSLTGMPQPGVMLLDDQLSQSMLDQVTELKQQMQRHGLQMDDAFLATVVHAVGAPLRSPLLNLIPKSAISHAAEIPRSLIDQLIQTADHRLRVSSQPSDPLDDAIYEQGRNTTPVTKKNDESSDNVQDKERGKERNVEKQATNKPRCQHMAILLKQLLKALVQVEIDTLSALPSGHGRHLSHPNYRYQHHDQDPDRFRRTRKLIDLMSLHAELFPELAKANELQDRVMALYTQIRLLAAQNDVKHAIPVLSKLLDVSVDPTVSSTSSASSSSGSSSLYKDVILKQRSAVIRLFSCALQTRHRHHRQNVALEVLETMIRHPNFHLIWKDVFQPHHLDPLQNPHSFHPIFTLGRLWKRYFRAWSMDVFLRRQQSWASSHNKRLPKLCSFFSNEPWKTLSPSLDIFNLMLDLLSSSQHPYPITFHLPIPSSSHTLIDSQIFQFTNRIQRRRPMAVLFLEKNLLRIMFQITLAGGRYDRSVDLVRLQLRIQKLLDTLLRVVAPPRIWNQIQTLWIQFDCKFERQNEQDDAFDRLSSHVLETIQTNQRLCEGTRVTRRIQNQLHGEDGDDQEDVGEEEDEEEEHGDGQEEEDPDLHSTTQQRVDYHPLEK